jgi:hypothetical protein
MTLPDFGTKNPRKNFKVGVLASAILKINIILLQRYPLLIQLESKLESLKSKQNSSMSSL